MLGVLTAQSANEPAPFAPTDPHGVHGAPFSPTRKLAPEELPTLSIHTPSPVAAFAQLAGVATELGEPVAVRGDELPEPHLERVLQRAGDRREVPVLDELLELAKSAGGDLHGGRRNRSGLPQEASNGFRAGGQFSVGPVLLESGFLLGAEADPEESARGRLVRICHFV